MSVTVSSIARGAAKKAIEIDLLLTGTIDHIEYVKVYVLSIVSMLGLYNRGSYAAVLPDYGP